MQHPPFATWSDTDHSSAVIITTTLCMLYWIIAGAVQQLLAFGQGIIFSWAESLFGVSMVSALVQTILVLVACHFGLGKSNEVLTAHELYKSEHLYYVSNVFYALTLGLIKCSAACLIANLTVKGMGSLRHVPTKQKLPLFAMLGLAATWTAGAIVALAVPCSQDDPTVNTKEVCMGTVDRWVGIFIGDAITDLAIAGYAASVIWRTQASVSKRLVWYLPFCIRICVVFWAGLRLLTIDQQTLTSDPTISLWLFVIMTQAQILFSILGAASPGMKRAMLDLATNYGNTTPEASKAGGSYQLKYLRSKRTRQQLSESNNDSSKNRTIPFTGPAKGSSIVRVSSRSRSRPEERVRSDGDSQEGIIRQDDFEVQYENSTNSERYPYGSSEEAYQPQRQ